MLKRIFLGMALGALLLGITASASSAQDFWKHHQPRLTAQNSGTTQLLIAVSPVNSRVVWAAGAGGTFVKTTDGGDHWTSGVVAGAENDQFRDVQGVSADEAYLLSIGNNTTDFKIYKTIDGGANWFIEFTNETVNAFYDCFAFWTPWRGLAHSDSVNGVFPELRTFDGRNWESIANNMPPAEPGEASFAASGTCITTQGFENAWITTGGWTGLARVIATRDGGNTWNAYEAPIPSSPSAGGISIAFRDPWHGILAGGDLSSNTAAATATSGDGGKTWNLTTTPPTPGAIFCVAYANGRRLKEDIFALDPEEFFEDVFFGHEFDRTVVVTAETAPDFAEGSAAWSPDEGTTWYDLPTASGYWGLAFANPANGWFVGNNGQILKISF